MHRRPRRSDTARAVTTVSVERRRALRWLLVPATSLVAPGVFASAGRIASARVWPAQEYTRVILEGAAPVTHQLATLANPPRLVLDLAGVEMSPAFAELPALIGASDPYIAGVRVGRPSPAVLRVVFDLRADVNPQVFQLPPVASFGHRLVLDLYPAHPVDPLMALLEREESRRAVEAPAGTSSPALVTQESPRIEVPRSRRSRRIVVAVDPGHGGEDPGAVGRRGTYEKHVVLAISRKLKRVLEADANVRVVLTRDDDYFVPLAQRVAKARRVSADLFVSIHADAFREARARGSSVFALSENGATSVAARWLAEKENASDLIGGVSLPIRDPALARTLLDLSQTAQISDSLKVGRHVLAEIAEHNALHKPAVEQAGFAVLKAPDIPSILVETAFISNPDEEQKLKSDRHQQRFAESIGDGIRRYFAGNPPLARG